MRSTQGHWTAVRVFAVLILALLEAACAQAPTATPVPDTVQPPLTGDDGACEPVTAIICSSVDIDYGYFPNLRDLTQNEAANEILDFRLLFETACSGAVLHFFCSYYFPFCNPAFPASLKKLLPCRSLCELVRASCEPEFNNTAEFSWPDFLNCSLSSFTDDLATPDALCYAPQDPATVTVPTISGLLTPVPQTVIIAPTSSTTALATSTAVVEPSSTPLPSVPPTSSAPRTLSPLLPTLTLSLATITLHLLSVSALQS